LSQCWVASPDWFLHNCDSNYLKLAPGGLPGIEFS
jgi:hypothetical protein